MVFLITFIWCVGYDFTKGYMAHKGSWDLFNNWPEKLGKHLKDRTK